MGEVCGTLSGRPQPGDPDYGRDYYQLPGDPSANWEAHSNVVRFGSQMLAKSSARSQKVVR